VARVKKELPDARAYAVQYPADRTPQSPETGALDVVNRLKKQTTACPDQKFVLVGYSQGARTIRKATARPDWDAKWNDKIVAVVTYGDPGQRNPVPRPAPAFPAALQAKTALNCAKGDPACDATADNSNFDAHLTYNKAGTTFQADSAAFVVAAFKGLALPKVNNAPR
jgi:cutinase